MKKTSKAEITHLADDVWSWLVQTRVWSKAGFAYDMYLAKSLDEAKKVITDRFPAATKPWRNEKAVYYTTSWEEEVDDD